MNLPKLISQKTYQSLVAEKNALQAKVDRMDALGSSASVQAEVSRLKADHATALDALRADHANEIATLKASLVGEHDSSERKAISILARIGVSENELPKVSRQGEKSLDFTKSSLKGEELADYLERNLKEVSARLRKTHGNGV